MKKIILCIAMALTTLTVTAETAADVKEIIVKVNDAWQQGHPGPEYGGTKKGLSAFWDNAVYHTGNMEACRLFTGEKLSQIAWPSSDAVADDLAAAKRWHDYSLAWAEKNKWQGASETDPAKWKYKNYGEGQDYVLFGDWQICFQTYLDLYSANPVIDGNLIDRRIKRAKEVMDYEVNSGKADYWWWADALYMVMPVFSKLYVRTHDEKYLDQMYANWQYANSIMYDKESGLYFRDGKYVYPKHTTAAGKKDIWARGDGWVMAAFAKVLKDMPKKYKHRKEIVKYYKKMACAVVACQQPEGHWTRSMLDAEQAPGYETSGTALICYSLYWGVNNGVLPKSYRKAADKAWHYLSTVALQPDYSIGYVQPIGEKAIPGQVVNQKSTSNFGTGAFLLAACERARYLGK